MKKVLFGITWASAQTVYWIPVLLAACGLVYYAYLKRSKCAQLLAAQKWVATFLPGYSPKKLVIKSILLAVAFSFLFLALLQPQWDKKNEVVEQEGRELFIALDISRSMLASDIKPNRLAFAKAKIKRLLKLLPSERVGLLVFSGSAVVQCPLTRDTGLFNMFLNQVDAQTISSGTTAIDQAITKIVKVFEKLPVRKNKVLVVFTDGEDFSRNLSSVREQAQKVGLHIFTYGVGTQQGGPIPVLNEQGMPIGYEKNEQGNVILSRLNPGILQALSRETGAKYIAPTQNSDDLESLVVQVENYEKEKFDDKELSTEEDRYPYFLGIALLCLLMEWLL